MLVFLCCSSHDLKEERLHISGLWLDRIVVCEAFCLSVLLPELQPRKYGSLRASASYRALSNGWEVANVMLDLRRSVWLVLQLMTLAWFRWEEDDSTCTDKITRVVLVLMARALSFQFRYRDKANYDLSSSPINCCYVSVNCTPQWLPSTACLSTLTYGNCISCGRVELHSFRRSTAMTLATTNDSPLGTVVLGISIGLDSTHCCTSNDDTFLKLFDAHKRTSTLSPTLPTQHIAQTQL